MPETAAQYIARITGHVGDKQPIEILRATPQRLRQLLKSVPEQQIHSRPAPGKWSIIEILAHLADVEIVVGFRVRMVLGAPDGVPIVAFDQDDWARSLDYSGRKLENTLRSLEAARQTNIELYEKLTPAQLEKFGMHSERGKETVAHIIKLQAGHDLNHIQQIEAALAERKAVAG